MNKEIEVPVGDTIELDGKAYRCEEAGKIQLCPLCAFDDESDFCWKMECSRGRRTDGKSVYFVEVEE